MIRITYWDLSTNEHLREKKICVDEPFFLNLSLEIQIGKDPAQSFFVLSLTNPKHLKKHKVEMFDRVMFLYEDFYVKDLVDSIKAFIENLRPSSEAEALLMLRKLFRWEFEDNLIYDFGRAISLNPDLD